MKKTSEKNYQMDAEAFERYIQTICVSIRELNDQIEEEI